MKETPLIRKWKKMTLLNLQVEYKDKIPHWFNFETDFWLNYPYLSNYSTYLKSCDKLELGLNQTNVYVERAMPHITCSIYNSNPNTLPEIINTFRFIKRLHSRAIKK